MDDGESGGMDPKKVRPRVDGAFPSDRISVQDKKMKATVVKDGDYCVYLRGRGNEAFDIIWGQLRSWGAFCSSCHAQNR